MNTKPKVIDHEPVVLATRLVSICIPTYNRPSFLREALDSCLAQTYKEFEILVGDDSKDEVSGKLAEDYISRHPGRIRYHKNVPSLGQNKNVNDLFQRAAGSRLVLLHDDDLLLPNALERLSSCWEQLPSLSAVFGKQYLVDQKGEILLNRSEQLNRGYNRTSAHSGRQRTPAIAGILRMFPNDGFMADTELARQIGYRPRDEVGDACDFDFGMRFCLAAKDVWYLDEYVAKYRLSGAQLSKTALPSPYSYDILKSAQLPPDASVARRRSLAKLAPGAASGFARMGKPQKALKVYVSSDYTIRNRFRIRAIYHAILIIGSFIRQFLRARA